MAIGPVIEAQRYPQTMEHAGLVQNSGEVPCEMSVETKSPVEKLTEMNHKRQQLESESMLLQDEIATLNAARPRISAKLKAENAGLEAVNAAVRELSDLNSKVYELERKLVGVNLELLCLKNKLSTEREYELGRATRSLNEVERELSWLQDSIKIDHRHLADIRETLSSKTEDASVDNLKQNIQDVAYHSKEFQEKTASLLGKQANFEAKTKERDELQKRVLFLDCFRSVQLKERDECTRLVSNSAPFNVVQHAIQNCCITLQVKTAQSYRFLAVSSPDEPRVSIIALPGSTLQDQAKIEFVVDKSLFKGRHESCVAVFANEQHLGDLTLKDVR